MPHFTVVAALYGQALLFTPLSLSSLMSALATLSQVMQTADFQQDYQAAIREKARQHNSFIAYIDEQGRMVREYPASGEIYEVNSAQQTLTLLSVHGKPVTAAVAVPVQQLQPAHTA